MTPAAVIRRSARMCAGRTAAWFEGREQTYGEL